MILITVVLIRTVGIFTDEDPEAEIRQLALSHTVSHLQSQDSSLGLSKFLLADGTTSLPPRSAATLILSPSVWATTSLPVPRPDRGPAFPGQVAHVLRENLIQFL